jgi:hypothetical protein
MDEGSRWLYALLASVVSFLPTKNPEAKLTPGFPAEIYQELYASVHHGLAFTLINSTSKTSAA